jgi:hypothetical protein
MSRMIPLMALVGALGTAACGATTGDSTSAPNTPPSTSQTTQTPPAGPTEVNASTRGVIPVGQEIDVRLQSSLSSETAKPEQRFEATTAVDITQDGQVLVPAGSVVRGVVSSVEPAGRLDRSGSLQLSFDQITVRGRQHEMRGMATRVFESKGIREEVGTAGAGAGIGGVIGGILGGVQGAVLGAVIGAGGAIAATDGKDITLPAGSIIRVRLDAPVTVR